ncbi:carbohydrate ABC transporter permease [Paenibacillus chibensis]|uniref:Carbohydrate ABC transporter permease n=1 Tax=Paenibacillus chibensis TaxID=59846 RepID=A0ABU6PMU3_9BACL|nr:carbohydrate ABC transporter permease [Paenibacillus chibensis]MEC0370697.1 carbohydrate ABC transporter permease [Paenibacillus chibensis]MED5016184.1 carbohydrate ABC transporter permease [Paenibacillus chibensis]
MLHNSKRDKVLDIVNFLLLALIALTMLFPFYYMFVVSFATYDDFVKSEILLWPKTWVLDAYQYIIGSKEFVRSVGVTIYVTVVGTVVSLLLTAMMAYALSRKILGQKVFMFMVLFTFVFSAGMIPSYMIVQATGLMDSLWALIIPGAISSFNMIVMKEFFANVPYDLTEAAIIDGANDLHIFARIILPLSKPALAAFGLFYAVGLWNSYFTSLLYLNNPAKWTVQVILRQMIILNQGSLVDAGAQAGFTNPPPAETIGMAAVLVATIPILIVYPFLQKHFAKGVMLGSVKE